MSSSEESSKSDSIYSSPSSESYSQSNSSSSSSSPSSPIHSPSHSPPHSPREESHIPINPSPERNETSSHPKSEFSKKNNNRGNPKRNFHLTCENFKVFTIGDLIKSDEGVKNEIYLTFSRNSFYTKEWKTFIGVIEAMELFQTKEEVETKNGKNEKNVWWVYWNDLYKFLKTTGPEHKHNYTPISQKMNEIIRSNFDDPLKITLNFKRQKSSKIVNSIGHRLDAVMLFLSQVIKNGWLKFKTSKERLGSAFGVFFLLREKGLLNFDLKGEKSTHESLFMNPAAVVQSRSNNVNNKKNRKSVPSSPERGDDDNEIVLKKSKIEEPERFSFIITKKDIIGELDFLLNRYSRCQFQMDTAKMLLELENFIEKHKN